MNTLENLWGSNSLKKINKHQIFIKEILGFEEIFKSSENILDFYNKLGVKYSLEKIFNMDKKTLLEIYNYHSKKKLDNKSRNLKILLSNLFFKLNLIKESDSKYILNDDFELFCNTFLKIEIIKENLKELEYLIRDYYSVSELGRGAFGIVYKAINITENQYVSIKKILKNEKFKPAEIENLKLLDSKYFLYYIEDFEDEKYVYIVTEYLEDYVPLSSLTEEISNGLYEKNVYYENMFYKICKNLFKGIKILHTEYKIVHSDIKPANIMVNKKNFDIKYIDFGLSCHSDDCEKRTGRTKDYVDPLLFLKKKLMNFGTRSQGDLWSLGATIYSVVVSKSPLKVYRRKNKDEDEFFNKYKYNEDLNYNYTEKILENLRLKNKKFKIDLNKLLTQEKRVYFY